MRRKRLEAAGFPFNGPVAFRYMTIAQTLRYWRAQQHAAAAELLPQDFSDLRAVSLEPIGDDVVRLTVEGHGGDARRSLRAHKDRVNSYEVLRRLRE